LDVDFDFALVPVVRAAGCVVAPAGEFVVDEFGTTPDFFPDPADG
jgi:hypothetical protein